MKTDRLLEEIKSRTDIVDLISEYVQLKKTGQNWKGLCPFHSEKTPSFTVSQVKQMFHCFGCSTGGDVFAFIMKHENLSFQEALALLAKKAGVALPDAGSFRRTSEKDEKIRNILIETREYFSEQLGRSSTASAYVKERGISEDMLRRFRVGYAPEGWQNLTRHLKTKGYKEQELVSAGLAVAGNKGTYDMFRNRVIFPIENSSGTVIAFGGRAFGDATPKYLNSPETAVFKKSETLYGLYHAKEEIRKQGRVLITEGYMDVIICHQYGFGNAVAPLGTALTAGHLQRLRTLAGRALLVFDGDAAGKAAAKRALPFICQNNFLASVLILPDQEDPDSYLRKNGAESFAQLLEKAQGIIGFLFTVNRGDKLNTVREALGLIAAVKDLLAADEMLRELADISGTGEMTLREELKRMKGGGTPAGVVSRESRRPAGNSEEYMLLSAVIAFPEKAGYVLSRISLDDIKNKTISSVLAKIAADAGRNGLAGLIDQADDEERCMITRFSVDPGLDPEYVDRSIDDCIIRIARKKLDDKIAMAQRTGDRELSNALLLEKKKLIQGTCS